MGSYISGATPIDFTGDIKEIDGRPIAKRGRIPGVTESPAAQAASTWRRTGTPDGGGAASVARAGSGWPAFRATARGMDDERAVPPATVVGTRRRRPPTSCCSAASALLAAGITRRPRSSSSAQIAWNPAKASILEALGRAYYNSGQAEAARATFERLLAIDPSAHYAHFALAQSLKRLGRPAEAGTHLRLAVALHPGSTLYRHALARLRVPMPPRRDGQTTAAPSPT